MKRILSVTLYREVDHNPDTSWIGVYVDTPGPADRTIDRKARCEQGRGEYRYFIAAMSGAETGNPESVEQDYQRLESLHRGDWCFVGIRAEAEVQLVGSAVQRISSGGLWGIEPGDGFFAGIENEELSYLRKELLAIGFSDAEITTAFADVERKGNAL